MELQLTRHSWDGGGHSLGGRDSAMVRSVVAKSWLSGRLPVHQSHLVPDLLNELELVDLLLLQGHQLVQDHGDGHGGDASSQGPSSEALRELRYGNTCTLQRLEGDICAGHAVASGPRGLDSIIDLR